MKKFGPIPAGFTPGDGDGQLVIGGKNIQYWTEQAGDTPLFLYSSAHIQDRVAALRAALPKKLGLHYAMKANPFAPLLIQMKDLVDGFDVASGGELEIALAAGINPENISFAGPGKRDRELHAAILHGVTLNIESGGEAERALNIAGDMGKVAKLAVRVNPGFDLKGSGMKMGGGAKPFGVDVDQVPDLVRHIMSRGGDWCGFHIYAGSQALDAGAIIDMQAQTIGLAATLAHDVGTPPRSVNLGGGFGIPYFAGDVDVDIMAVGAALSAQFSALPDILAETEFCIELGRYLVGQAGIYVTRIVDRKISHGEIFLVTDGGLHHQLAASGNFGTVIRRNYPVAIAHKFNAEPVETVSIVGCLCTPLDKLSDQVHLPRADVGDLVVIFCAGAYGASASPAHFLGQGPAAEILV